MPTNFYKKGTITFGGHIKTLRIAVNVGQRELARILGISPSYLNDIENNKRFPPRKEIIKKSQTF